MKHILYSVFVALLFVHCVQAAEVPFIELKGHTDEVLSVTFSPDGKTVATTSDDLTARIWDAETGKEWQKLEGHTSRVWSARFFPDGKKIVTSSEDRITRVFDVETGEKLYSLEGHNPSFSPNGKMIVTVIPGVYQIWDGETIKELKLSGLSDEVRYVQFSPDEQRIATSSIEKIQIWNAASGEELHQFVGRLDYALFSPDGKKIIRSHSGDGSIRIHDVETGRELFRLGELRSGFTGWRFSPDGKIMSASPLDGNLHVFVNAESGQELGRIRGQTGGWSPDGKKFITYGNYTDAGRRVTHVFDTKSFEKLKELRGGATAAYFSPDGGKIVTINDETSHETGNVFRIFDTESGEELYEGKGIYLNFLPDGKRMITMSPPLRDENHRDFHRLPQNYTYQILDIESGKEPQTLEGGSLGPIGRMRDIEGVTTISPSGVKIATTNRDHTARIWTVPTIEGMSGELEPPSVPINAPISVPDANGVEDRNAPQEIIIAEERTEIVPPVINLRGHTNRVWSVAVSPDGKKIVTASGEGAGQEDRSVRIWDAESGKELLQLLKDAPYVVTSVAFSPVGKKIATSSGDGIARTWDADSGEELQKFVGHQLNWSGFRRDVTSVAFSPDGKKIGTAGMDYTVRIWDVDSGRELHKLGGSSFAFVPNGTKIVTTGGMDSNSANSIRVWDTESGEELRGLGGSRGFSFVRVSPDGKKMVATGGIDRAFRHWNAETWEELRGPNVPFNQRSNFLFGSDRIGAVEFSPDSKKIVTSSGGIIEIWNADSGALLHAWRGDQWGINSVIFTPCGKKIVAVGGGPTLNVSIWDISAIMEENQ